MIIVAAAAIFVRNVLTAVSGAREAAVRSACGDAVTRAVSDGIERVTAEAASGRQTRSGIALCKYFLPCRRLFYGSGKERYACTSGRIHRDQSAFARRSRNRACSVRRLRGLVFAGVEAQVFLQHAVCRSLLPRLSGRSVICVCLAELLNTRSGTEFAIVLRDYVMHSTVYCCYFYNLY